MKQRDIGRGNELRQEAKKVRYMRREREEVREGREEGKTILITIYAIATLHLTPLFAPFSILSMPCTIAMFHLSIGSLNHLP